MLAHLLPRTILGLGLTTALIGSGAVVTLQGSQASPLLLMACFLFGFGLFKGALGIDAALTLRCDDDARSRLADMHGSPGAVRAWIAYKLTAMTVAVAAAIVCIVVAL